MTIEIRTELPTERLADLHAAGARFVVSGGQIIEEIEHNGPEDDYPEALAPVHRHLGGEIELIDITVFSGAGDPFAFKAWVAKAFTHNQD